MSDNPNRPNPGIVQPGTGRVPPSPTRVEPAPGHPRTTGPANPPRTEQKSSGFPTVLAVVAAIVVIGIVVWLFAGRDAVELGPMDNGETTNVTIGAPEETTPVAPATDPVAPPVQDPGIDVPAPGTDPGVPLEDPAPDVQTPGIAPDAPLEDPAPDLPTPGNDPNAPVLDAPATGGTTVN